VLEGRKKYPMGEGCGLSKPSHLLGEELENENI
jgi:hypothetical protein